VQGNTISGLKGNGVMLSAVQGITIDGGATGAGNTISKNGASGVGFGINASGLCTGSLVDGNLVSGNKSGHYFTKNARGITVIT